MAREDSMVLMVMDEIGKMDERRVMAGRASIKEVETPLGVGFVYVFGRKGLR